MNGSPILLSFLDIFSIISYTHPVTQKTHPSRLVGLVVLILTFYMAWRYYGGEVNHIKEEGSKPMNHLAKEKSPYLLQHKDNPVHWYAWGPQAFEAAKKQNKLIFLSIGYSTCHWCHVMEHDSFEKQEVADALNKDYIAIKVDREERPDVDQIYMDAVVAMTGRGGWPMSVFLTPDLKPFYGGTFFWKDQFLKVLEKIQEAWLTQKDEIFKTANDLTAHLSADSTSSQNLPTQKAFMEALHVFGARFDPVYGGYSGAPKFPRSIDLNLLMRIFRRTGNAESLHMVELTLDKMAQGGMYDHVGGGFARYSTDTKWLVPHFEKMLYDNALLTLTYLEAYQLTKKEHYKIIARETLDYVLRDMTSSEGGFYSAEDADSEGVEGKFYLWTIAELQQILSDQEYEAIVKAYHVQQNGNYHAEFEEGIEGGNILYATDNLIWDSKQSGPLKAALQKLFEVREKRIHPHKDDKILTDWNGLMIAAMAKAYAVLGDERYLEAAQKAASFIQTHLDKHDKLLRRYRDKDARVHAMLSDYAYLNWGLIELFLADGDARWMSWAQSLQSRMDASFWDEKSGNYFYGRGDDSSLVIRSKELHDNATPSANSVALYNLVKLVPLTGNGEYQTKVDAMFKSLGDKLIKYPAGFAMAMLAFDYETDISKEIVIVGDDQYILEAINRGFYPNIMVVSKNKSNENLALMKGRMALDGKTTYYVCEKSVCNAPTINGIDVLKQLEKVKPYE
ncbi:thioredoxin domain-containing protein [bacterium]|nr:thioredoxin domain-containing protein [bacterium]